MKHSELSFFQPQTELKLCNAITVVFSKEPDFFLDFLLDFLLDFYSNFSPDFFRDFFPDFFSTFFSTFFPDFLWKAADPNLFTAVDIED